MNEVLMVVIMAVLGGVIFAFIAAVICGMIVTDKTGYLKERIQVGCFCVCLLLVMMITLPDAAMLLLRLF